MRFALVNMSSDRDRLTSAILERIAFALEIQLSRDYAPLWQASGAPVRVYGSIAEVPLDDRTSPLLVFDDPDQAGVYGWHSVRADGRAFGRAFWRVIERNGGEILRGPNSLSATLSHEALEMMGNPYVNLWADMGDGTLEAVELCDRVQSDAYEIDGVSVSDILGPRAFRSGDGPYDHMDLLRESWEIRPGGYCIRRRGAEFHQVWGSEVPAWLREIKARSVRLAAQVHDALVVEEEAG